MNLKKRGLTIFFCDGTKLHIEFPPQTDNETAAMLRMEELLKQKQIIAEIDGALIVIPFDNVKYIQGYPAPSKLPRGSIKGASVRD
jgi:hypothetical protein